MDGEGLMTMPERSPWTLLFVLLSLVFSAAFGQKQVVILKKEKVIHRYEAGDDIYIKLRGSEIRIHSYINNILDDAIVLAQDTFLLENIEYTYAPEKHFINALGRTLVTVGVGLFLIDQFNWVVVQRNEAELDRGVTTVSLSCLATGLPMMLIKREGQKLGYKYRMMCVDDRSPFYRG